MNSVTGSAANSVSLFQTNSIAYLDARLQLGRGRWRDLLSRWGELRTERKFGMTTSIEERAETVTRTSGSSY
jgi:hypothetical protein